MYIIRHFIHEGMSGPGLVPSICILLQNLSVYPLFLECKCRGNHGSMVSRDYQVVSRRSPLGCTAIELKLKPYKITWVKNHQLFFTLTNGYWVSVPGLAATSTWSLSGSDSAKSKHKAKAKTIRNFILLDLKWFSYLEWLTLSNKWR